MSDELPRVELSSEFRVAAPGKRCRFPRCGREAVMEMNRRRRRWRATPDSRTDHFNQWWAYCPIHNYGRVVRDGEVWYDPDEAARFFELERPPA